jgi:UDP-N-acetylmuramoylalanine--D-glutamate ligase
MADIVEGATSLAHSGDAVVLSPGFASFGLFTDFEDRGRKFNAAVEVL